MKNKILSALLVTAMVATMLTGCGDKKDDTSSSDTGKDTEQTSDNEKEDSDSAKDVTLKTVSMFGGTDPNGKAYQAINEQFQKDNPNIKVEDNSGTADQDWKAAVAADFAVDNEPDVIQFFTEATANAVLATDKFVTIEEIQKEYPDYGKDITEDAWSMSANPDGVNRAVPTTGFWEGIFCNKDLFDKFNVELPKDWDGLVKAIETFKANDITPIAVTLNKEPHYWIEHLMLYTAGADEYTKVPDSAPDSWVKGLELFKTLRDMGAFPQDTDTLDGAGTTQLLLDKKAAMLLDGSWRAGAITDQDNTVVIPFPGVENQKAEANTIITGMTSGFYITKKAWDDPDKRDAAAKFVMAHTSKESVKKYWEATGSVQVASVDLSEEMNKTDGLNTMEKTGRELITNAKKKVIPTDARIGTDPYSAITSSISKISVGQGDAKQTIEEALKLYKDLQ